MKLKIEKQHRKNNKGFFVWSMKLTNEGKKQGGCKLPIPRVNRGL